MKNFLFIVLIALSFNALGQSNTTPKTGDPEILYPNELSFGLGLHARGWTLFGNYAKVKPGNKKNLYQLEFVEIKHPKEVRQTSEYNLERFGYNPPRQYAFGKINNFYALHLTSGVKRVIGQKAEKNGIEIQWMYLFGGSLGFLKPYYLDLIEPNDSPVGFDVVETKYEGDTANNFLDKTFIYGSSGFGRGLGEIRINPGIHAKTGLNFDWGSANTVIKSLEVGLSGDFYIKPVDIMALENNKPVFFYLYLTMQLGKRW